MASSTPRDSAIPEELRCKYTQSICFQERALKPSGERHHLCDFHRQNANAAQLRFAKKKRDDYRRDLLLKLAMKKAAAKGVEAGNLMEIEGVQSELTFEMSDLIPLGEITDESGLQLEDVVSTEEDFEWLKAALGPSTNH